MAALLVVYFHSDILIRELPLTEDTHFALFGQCGVDVFFVLSGLLMWQSTRHGPYPTLLFYKKRLARIAPLYWVVTLLAAAVAFAAPALLRSTHFESGHVLASIAFVPWPNPAAGDRLGVLMTPVIVPGWTLNFEAMFYVLFGLALIGPRKQRLGRVLLLFASFMTLVVLLGPSIAAMKFYDPFLVAEFLLGVGIGVILERERRLPPGWATGLLAVAVLVLLVLDAVEPPVSRLFSLGVPAAVAIYCLATLEEAGRWPSMAWLCRLGDASFSIYLTHVFVLAAIRLVCSLPAMRNVTVPEPAFLLLALSASCLVGLLTFRLVERPLGTVTNRMLGLQR